jgi:hypothetical protein
MTSTQESVQKSEVNHSKARSVFLSGYFIANTSMVVFYLGLCGYFVFRYWNFATRYWELFWAPGCVITLWRLMWRNRERLRDFRRTGLVISDVESGSQVEQSLEAGTNDIDLILFYSLLAILILSFVLLYVFRHL